MTVPEIVGKLLDEWKILHAFDGRRGAAPAPRVPRAVRRDATSRSSAASWRRRASRTSSRSATTTRATLLLTDKPHGADPRAGGPVPFVESPGMNAARDFVTKVRTSREIRPGAVTLRDFDFRGRLDLPALRQGGAGAGPGGAARAVRVHAGRVRHGGAARRGEGGARRPEGGDGARRARPRRRAHAEAGGRASRPTRSTSRPAGVFSIGGHPQDGHLLAARPARGRAAHRRQRRAARRRARRGPCSAETPFRPAQVTPKPRISGVQSAIVVGPKGEEIHTDEHGRVRVQFPWDREGQYDENSSCWVRVSQGWAGTRASG